METRRGKCCGTNRKTGHEGEMECASFRYAPRAQRPINRHNQFASRSSAKPIRYRSPAMEIVPVAFNDVSAAGSHEPRGKFGHAMLPDIDGDGLKQTAGQQGEIDVLVPHGEHL
jgi:hypothetical protein